MTHKKREFKARLHGAVFVHVTTIKKKGCVDVSDTVHIVQLQLSQSYLCVRCHT